MSSAPDALAPNSRRWPERTLLALLLAQFVPIGAQFPYHAFARQDAWGLRLFALALAALGAAAIVGVWRRAPWALWAVVVLVSLKVVVDVFGYTHVPDLRLPAISTLANGAMLVIASQLAPPIGERISSGQRAFFGCVLALAGWVAVRGLFFPAHLSHTIPFNVPPLHSRFLGAMYLSGATFMLLAIRAHAWREIRIVVPMVAIWTGMLGLVSLRFLDAFDWRRAPTWTWFVAYSAFPIVAAWIAWRQRGRAGTDVAAADVAAGEDGSTTSPAALSPSLRTYLRVQGIAVLLLALALLGWPQAMTAVWPWKISPQLAQVYSAPFLSYGIGSLLAARASARAEVRIALTATLVFAAVVLAVSTLHRSLFAAAAPATWLWFGGFGVASAALLWFVLPSRKEGRP